MRKVYCSLIIAGAALALAGTANAARGNRDGAMERCIAQAQQAAPDIPGSGGGRTRTDVYKSCMHQAGYRP